MISIVKIGGGENVARNNILDDVAQLILEGHRIVIVHGASGEIQRLGEFLGRPPKYITSPSGMRSRYTDKEALQVALMAFSAVNKDIVAHLCRKSIRAVGLSGMDGWGVTGHRKQALRAFDNGHVRIIRDDWSARISSVNPSLIRCLLDNGFTPVISPPALDHLDGPVNVDADRLAAAIAVALLPSHLFLLTNVPGLLEDKADPSSLIQCVAEKDIERALQLAEGRMKLKVLAAHEAVQGGVSQVVIADSRKVRPVRSAIDSYGTTFAGSRSVKSANGPSGGAS
ncbi:[LysW]-aminoadipate kinase [Consotaella aegiceratis]|uniref:[LysW]-aminoadipate kinase n=1 Tax=Consotaella aegiceratis TaxID=3097961 RepID=UPI002F42F093